MFIDAVFYCVHLILVLIRTSVTELVSQARANFRTGPYRLEIISACTAGAYHP